uniref:Gibberellin 3 beta-hydroxylase n=1 Tax=Pisum sativum TaxID=3888 RepID=O24638_PEA|nr:gibberellin 3 beta-hydroxylase [Pisum sativum]AAC96014.1 gibberellin 3B-hydroxylase [Pisum sativum]AAC96016.1 truncated gibberellin 3B-hydroxylase [Pisum sativum]
MPSLSEAYRAHPVHVNHKHPDFNSLQELPESYNWTHLDDHTLIDSNNIMKESTTTVPVIDLNDPNASKLIGLACKTWGVYQVMNHGIPLSLLEDIQWLGQTLFSLPSHQKHKATRSPDGVSGYGILVSLPSSPNSCGMRDLLSSDHLSTIFENSGLKIIPDSVILSCNMMKP